MSHNHLTRRRFLHVAGVVATGLLGPFSRRVDAATETSEQPLLRFVQWNDVHVSPTPSAYVLANEKLDYLVNCANAGSADFSKPDFVIGVGDMVNGGFPNLTPDFALLKATLAGLKCPYYPVMGNHESDGLEGNATHQAPYNAVFGVNRVNYSFQAAGIQFVMFDNSGGGKIATRDQWIHDTLNASPGVPKVLCCHVPLVPMRDPSVLEKSFGFGGYYRCQDPKLLELVEDPSHNVVAVLSGHLHLTGMVWQKGVCHISISGTASYPCDFASYEVFADRISVRVHGLPKELTTPKTDIHGKPRYKIDYADAAHPTHELYVRGGPAERDFDIPLRKKN